VFRPQQIPKPLPQQIPQHLAQPPPQSSLVNNLHGGFVPMLIKTANQSIVKHFAMKAAQTQTQTQLQSPSSPINQNLFNQNTSVPFHSTFRAPSPDFSGFNISRYGDLSPKASLNNIKPFQLNKPLVPPPSRPKPERVNNPVRYRIKPQHQTNDKEFLIPDKDVFHEYVDANQSNKDENDYMLAVERGSQSAESQSNAAFVKAQNTDHNRFNPKVSLNCLSIS